MKKLFIWLIPLIVVCVMSVGIVIGITVSKNSKQSNVFATELSYKYDKLTLQKDNETILTQNEIEVKPRNCTQKLYFSTNNTSILSVDAFSGKIKGLKVGTCNLIVSINKSEVEKITINIPVEVVENNTSEKTKTYNSYELVFENSDFIRVEYETTHAKDECDGIILRGNELVESFELDYKQIKLSVTGVGVVEILVSTPSEEIYITINVI